MMRYPALDDAGYTALRKALLKEKGGDQQKALLTAARDSRDFIGWLEQRIGPEGTGEPFDIGDEQLSEGEYKELPAMVEQQLFERWAGLTPALASEETFWGYVTLTYIRQGLIEAHFLAGNSANLAGLERIDRALKDDHAKGMDDVTRTILRRLGGLPEVRGKRSVYVDCPFARAWWRGYVAREVCAETGADFHRVWQTLTTTQTYWEKLIDLIVSRNAVLGDSKVRSALIWAVSERLDEPGLLVADTIRTISRQIGIRAAWQELAVFETSDLKQLMAREFLPKTPASQD